MLRRLVQSLVVLLVVALLGLAAGGWYYANQVLPAALAQPPEMEVEVVAVDGDRITLRPDASTPDHEVADLVGEGTVGFAHPGGYLQLSGVSAQTADGATIRSFEVVTGPPPAAGDRGDVQVAAYPDHPTALGLPVEEVVAPGPLGDLPGWVFPGEGPDADRWVVIVHGRGSTRTSGLRAVDVVTGRAGHSSLVVSHRNDPGAPPSPDGYGHYGDTEWRDLEAWLTWLADTRDPTHVTLYGLSQGGSVVAACLRRCEEIPRIDRAVLDSPLLSMHATLELQAEARGIPGPVIGPLLLATEVVVDLRGGPDFDRLEHVEPLVGLDLPILVLHGRDDDTVPIEPSRRLARADPAQVDLHAHDGGHVRGWNLQREAYSTHVVEFLEDSP